MAVPLPRGFWVCIERIICALLLLKQCLAHSYSGSGCDSNNCHYCRPSVKELSKLAHASWPYRLWAGKF